MKKKLFFAIGLLLLSSCSVVQIMFTEQISNNINVVNNNYVYENDTVKITYSFWADDGVMAFIIENKLKIPIYIDWKKSAFISNKTKLTYYSDIEVTNTKGATASAFLFQNTYDWSKWYPVTFGISASTSVKYREERISFIPPNSESDRASFTIFPNQTIIMDGIKKTQLDESKLKGKVVLFNKEEAIITFRNFITYSTKENFDKEFYVNNEFFVNKVIEVKAKHLNSYLNSQRFYVLIEYIEREFE